MCNLPCACGILRGELSYSVLPARYPSGEAWPTFLVVYLPGQLFGAYEFGRLVRWGPVSTGSRRSPTSAGRFNLNWRASGRASTVDPDWFMRWYFNFGNREGLAFHTYALPGYPASHGCVRLLERARCGSMTGARPGGSTREGRAC